jgi:hypothetical protein
VKVRQVASAPGWARQLNQIALERHEILSQVECLRGRISGTVGHRTRCRLLSVVKVETAGNRRRANLLADRGSLSARFGDGLAAGPTRRCPAVTMERRERLTNRSGHKRRFLDQLRRVSALAQTLTS